MKNVKLYQLWQSLLASYWFIPALMAASAVGLSLGMLRLDETSQSDIIAALGWTYTRDADGARTILSVIAGSSITVATTAFSITIVALQLASSQFGPRILRNFMQDRGNQVVLGTFIATFLYCLLVLRSVQGRDDGQFLPQLSVAFSIMLATLNLAVLIYFIHHAAESIQADNVVQRVSEDLERTIEQLFPQQLGKGHKSSESPVPADFARRACPVHVTQRGYIQVIDDRLLMKVAQENNVLMRLLHRPGHFVVAKATLVMVYPGERVDKQLASQINRAFVLGAQRTQQQDLDFAVEQLVEIAVRALSPGINDPFTAMRCIDQLGAALCRLAQKDIPSPYRTDERGTLRIIANPITFADIIDTAFDQIRQYSRSAVEVRIRLLEAIANIAAYTHQPQDHLVLKRHAQMIYHVHAESECESERTAIEEQFLTVKKLLD
ncbi:MAG: DUF2254 domain-containing protein [Cyanophyceae cyanobacterium]